MFKSKKIILLSVALMFLSVFMSGCNKSIVKHDGMEIVIENKETGLKHAITNKDSLEEIVMIVNSSQKEFRIFKPQKEMTLKYANGKETTILINNDGHHIKIDGISYVNSYGL